MTTKSICRRCAADRAPGAGAEITGDAPAARSDRAAQPAIADRVLAATGDGDGGGAACRHGAGNLVAEIVNGLYHAAADDPRRITISRAGPVACIDGNAPQSIIGARVHRALRRRLRWRRGQYRNQCPDCDCRHEAKLAYKLAHLFAPGCGTLVTLAGGPGKGGGSSANGLALLP